MDIFVFCSFQMEDWQTGIFSGIVVLSQPGFLLKSKEVAQRVGIMTVSISVISGHKHLLKLSRLYTFQSNQGPSQYHLTLCLVINVALIACTKCNILRFGITAVC